MDDVTKFDVTVGQKFWLYLVLGGGSKLVLRYQKDLGVTVDRLMKILTFLCGPQ